MQDPASESRSQLIENLQTLIHERLPAAEAEQATRFVARYYARISDQVLHERDPMDLYGAAVAHWGFARERPTGTARVRVYNPTLEESGWESPHTVVEIVVDDMPFLVDSLRMALNRQGLKALYIFHPIVTVERDGAGHLQAVLAPGEEREGAVREAVIHLEVVRQGDPATLAALHAELLRVLGDIRCAVEDWQPMRQALFRVLEEIEKTPPPVEPDKLQETKAFLRWLADDHFTFLGYRDYELAGEGEEETLRIVPGSGLGILRDGVSGESSRGFAGLPPALRERAREPRLMVLTKANAGATVHRPVHLDYVGIKRFDGERVVGEHRFLGLYGSRAYSCVPHEIPVLRRKLARVMERADLPPNSHSYKALQHILETYPRDELFQIGVNELYRISMGILQLGEQQRTRLFLRQDLYGRFIECLVYCPRERYDTQVRQRIQAILSKSLNGTDVEFVVSLTEAPMARILFTVRTRPGEIPAYDAQAIEAHLAEAVHSWQDHLQSALLEQLGEAAGSTLFQTFGEAFPAGYREDFPARTAVHDIRQMVGLDAANELAMSLYRPLEAAPGRLRFKVFRRGQPLPLSRALPMLENMGVRVEDERPYRVEPAGGEPVWLHDFGLAYRGGEAPDTGEIRELFQEAFSAVWQGRLADDSFNSLVLKARLDGRRISLLRAYAKYLRQTSLTYSQSYMEEALTDNPEIARFLTELFHARFDPAQRRHASQHATALVTRIQDALDAVASLDHDRILRSFLAALQATLRSNYFQHGADGAPKPYLSLKLDPAQLPDLPAPRPLFEIFVYSPRVEGVHLRGGKVARGGLRWSDRREDFRTEVLGLMKAQMVKNALIVPVGAKGGFVVKQPPEERDALRKEVQACYRMFISGLLDLTDNLHEVHCQPPPDLVRYDGDDPYLVVAADKGTATFSDLANEVAAGYGFWLGDAFASGGRTGYDHKKMGITARGAWECVRQHFNAAGIDFEHTPFTVVGIGDMSGDVFGNGLLLSRNTKLIAAFDHRHIFIDPDPDPETSFLERERLFALPASSWADYDPQLISDGGGVWSRSLKSVRLSPRAREVLEIQAEALTPADLIRALLKAPMDLLWNGGIGTYVRSSHERDGDIGDRSNDALRIPATALRCRVVGEGGNLGFTQPARIEYARAGGRIDTDFIHNAGGVNCSDHEVNIKILLDRVVVDGDLTLKQRDLLLEEMTGEVADLVLQDSWWQARAIALDEARAADLLPEQVRFLRALEQHGGLNRALEHLPGEKELARRQKSGEGLVRPELAVLVSYAKHTLFQALLESDLPESPCLAPELERYFPTPLRERFRGPIHAHRLRREILASTVANRLVNRCGATFVFRLQEELGVSAAAVVRAYYVAWEVYGLRRLWSAVVAMDGQVADAVLIDLLERAVRLLRRACRRLLQTRGEHIEMAALIERYGARLEGLASALPELVGPARLEAMEQQAAPLEQAGVARETALWVAGLDALYNGLDLVTVTDHCGVEMTQAAQVWFALGDELELDWLTDRLAALPGHDRWHAGARAALRDDLDALRRALCNAVLESGMEAASAQSRLQAWQRQNHAAVVRCTRLFADLRGQGEVDLAMLAVALRELRGLLPTPVEACDTNPAKIPS